jgi:hypothetical protein
VSEGGRIALEDAARMLGTNLEKLLIKTFELGIRIYNDRSSATDYITAADFEGLKASVRNGGGL